MAIGDVLTIFNIGFFYENLGEGEVDERLFFWRKFEGNFIRI